MHTESIKYVRDADRCKLDGAALALMRTIAEWADGTTGHCFMSRRKLAKHARIGETTVDRLLPMLVETGELARVIDGSGRRSDTWKIIGYEQTAEPRTAPISGALPRTTGPLLPPPVGALAGLWSLWITL